ncbi:MAG: tetratricopeptide repeat protein [Oscillospiraceae bacterium]|nr:tetratricopeptide repeat protein [Oscillospiraceae bacterium]
MSEFRSNKPASPARNIFIRGFKHGAAAVLAVFYFVAVIALFIMLVTGRTETAMTIGIMLFFMAFLHVCLAAEVLSKKEERYPFLTDAENKLIGDAFKSGTRRKVFYNAAEALSKYDYSTALNGFHELSEDIDKLTQDEKGVLYFYYALCYSRMDYSVNAAEYAVKAAECGKARSDSLLMAARAYAKMTNFEDAENCYEQLVKIALDGYMLPFVFNEAADIYIKDNKPEDAERMYHISLDHGLYVNEAQGGMAICSIMKKNAEDAAAWYRTALINNVPDPDGFALRCENMCKLYGLDKDILINAQFI